MYVYIIVWINQNLNLIQVFVDTQNNLSCYARLGHTSDSIYQCR